MADMPPDQLVKDDTLAGQTFVGRKEAREALLAALDAVTVGRSATIAVVGEAGSGKTALLGWLVGVATSRGMRVVSVCPVEGEADLPLAVMTDVLRPLSGYFDALLPEYREVLAAVKGVGSASSDRLLLAAATLAILAGAAEDKPTLLVIDDAHWVDPASARVLSFAVRRLLADRIAVVIAKRTGEADRIDGPWREVTLGGMAADERTRSTAATPTARTS